MKHEKQNIFLFYNERKHISFLLIKILFFLFLLSKENDEIRLVIKGRGSHQIFHKEFPENNFHLIINGNNNNTCKKKCTLDDDINNITIIFNERNYSCYKMFYQSINITEIDLSHLLLQKLWI